MAVLPRDLEERGEPLQLRVREEGAELLADQSVTDVLVPITIRPKRRLRVVCVQNPEPVETDPGIDVFQEHVQSSAVRHVDA